jgi:hypothetical protein
MGDIVKMFDRVKAEWEENKKLGLRRCSTCGEWKEKDEFHSFQRRNRCKKCQQNSNTDAKRANKELYNAINRRGTFRRAVGHNDINSWYEEQFKLQDGKCAMCGKSAEEERYGRLCIDHDHTTKQLRKLLCNRCNVAVGFYEAYKEQIELYLAEFSK